MRFSARVLASRASPSRSAASRSGSACRAAVPLIGLLSAVPKGQQEKALDEAVFKAKKGQLSGPVKTQFGQYIFEVTKITPASQQTLAQAKETIRQTLQSQNQQKALESFSKDYSERWKEKTDCREGYVIQQCKQGPKSTPQPTPAGGAPPQQQPQGN